MSEAGLPPEINTLLSRLRGRIQRYVLLEGTASVLVVLGALFWFSLALDWSYFRFQRAELPLWVRFLVEVAGISLCLVLFVGWVALRFWRGFRNRALALVLEKRFPELNDRLITAIELSDSNVPQPQLTRAMLARTVSEVGATASGLDLGSVFDKRPLVRAGLSASCLLISILAFAIAFTDVFQLWFRRNVLLANDVWKRETSLKVVVLAEPGERVVELSNQSYRHPRGSDLTIQANVIEGKKVPDQVQMRYFMEDGSARGRIYMSRLGTSQFKHTLTGVLQDLEFTLLAGDAERIPFHIQVVDSPRVDRITLNCSYPEYTGLNQSEEAGADRRTPRLVQGSLIALPAGTDFVLQGKTNKPLTAVRIQTAKYDLEFDTKSARVTLFQDDGQTRGGTFVLKLSAPLLPSGSSEFHVPFLLAGPQDQDVVDERGGVRLPLRLPPDALLKIFLHDQDDVRTADPARLTINSTLDEPPLVETQLRGIGSAITRKAVVPVTGVITDDYGVVDARFEYRIDNNDLQPRTFPVAPNKNKKFLLEQSKTQPWLRFDVLPLELKVGQKIVLSVVAQDGDTLAGPHLSQGEKYNFQIVSDEELLSQLYARELNLRQRFEQILTEILRTQTELTLARKQVQDLQEVRSSSVQSGSSIASDQSAKLEELEQLTTTAAERGLYGIRKNHDETQAIEQSLSDIRLEMVNNAVDTPQSLERIDSKLIKPFRGVNTTDFPSVDQRLGLFRLALQEKTQPLERLDDTLVALDVLKRKLNQILTDMRKLETYKELLEILKAIKSQQEELKKRTATENKKSIINKLK